MKPLNALLQGVEKVFKTEKEVSLMKTEHSKKWSHQRDIPSKNMKSSPQTDIFCKYSEYQVQKMNLITKPPLNSQYISSMGY